MKDLKKAGFSTRLIHGAEIDKHYHSTTVPIYQASAFVFDNVDEGAKCFTGDCNGFIYSRIGNPTIQALEKQVANLENGYDGIATSSGMAAISTIYMALLGKGDHIVSTDAVYGPARGLMENHFSRFGVGSSYVNTTDLKAIKEAIRPNTKMLYIETPSNPTLEITDLKACAAIAGKHGLLLVVDNTFSSPLIQRPIDYGADIVVHSMTKLINGHADIIAGMIIVKNKELDRKIRTMMVYMGCNMDPTQAFMVIRGLKTLDIRVGRAQENAMKMAVYLQKHPEVAWVTYPGLTTHPQHELAKKQMKGFGSMICFGLKDGFHGAKLLMNHVKIALLSVSLGGVETQVQHPASMTHAKVSERDKKICGITDDLIRLSVGIENIEDLIADIKQALAVKES